VLFGAPLILQGQAQADNVFKPLLTQPLNSRKVKKGLRLGLTAELNTMQPDTMQLVMDNYEKSLLAIDKGIDKGKFIWSDTLSPLVERVLYKLMSRNTIRQFLPVVLIANTPEANAMCLPSGAIVVTIGLLGRISTEDQLAFVLAHELQHHHLGHVRNRTYVQEKTKSSIKLQSTVKEILKGEEPIEEIMELKELFYESAKFSRKNELEADAGAIRLMGSLHYNPRAAIEALDLLELGLCSDSLYSQKLFQPLNTTKFPFKNQWISRDYKSEELFNPMSFFDKDSLKSHPETLLRKQEINRQVMSVAAFNVSKPNHIDSITRIARFQIVKSAYDEQFLDVALYQALSLVQAYGLNDYLIEYIGKTLLQTATLKQHPWTSTYFYRSTYGFCNSLQQTSNLLRNITRQEAGEILFQFMNQSKIFDPENELHYFLIWKACDLTPRITTGDKIRDQYFKKFPMGEHKKKMR